MPNTNNDINVVITEIRQRQRGLGFRLQSLLLTLYHLLTFMPVMDQYMYQYMGQSDPQYKTTTYTARDNMLLFIVRLVLFAVAEKWILGRARVLRRLVTRNGITTLNERMAIMNELDDRPLGRVSLSWLTLEILRWELLFFTHFHFKRIPWTGMDHRGPEEVIDYVFYPSPVLDLFVYSLINLPGILRLLLAIMKAPWSLLVRVFRPTDIPLSVKDKDNDKDIDKGSNSKPEQEITVAWYYYKPYPDEPIQPPWEIEGGVNFLGLLNIKETQHSTTVTAHTREHGPCLVIDLASDEITCVICWEDFEPPTYDPDTDTFNITLLRELPCNHFLHDTCMDMWFEIRESCPICNLDVDEILDRLEAEAESDTEPEQPEQQGGLLED